MRSGFTGYFYGQMVRSFPLQIGESKEMMGEAKSTWEVDVPGLNHRWD